MESNAHHCDQLWSSLSAVDCTTTDTPLLTWDTPATVFQLDTPLLAWDTPATVFQLDTPLRGRHGIHQLLYFNLTPLCWHGIHWLLLLNSMLPQQLWRHVDVKMEKMVSQWFEWYCTGVVVVESNLLWLQGMIDSVCVCVVKTSSRQCSVVSPWEIKDCLTRVLCVQLTVTCFWSWSVES